jgi:hypothetical protein
MARRAWPGLWLPTGWAKHDGPPRRGARGPGCGRHCHDRSRAGGRQDDQQRQGPRRARPRLWPLTGREPQTVAHVARVVVAAFVAVVVIAVTVVAVAVVAAVFMIAWPGAGGTAGGAGHAGMSAKERRLGGCRA